jgi:hypothetical protein
MYGGVDSDHLMNSSNMLTKAVQFESSQMVLLLGHDTIPNENSLLNRGTGPR